MTIELPVRYYCAVPSRDQRGLTTEVWALDLARTALIELHCWNFGFPGAPSVPEDYWVFMGSPQNHDRMLGIVTQGIAPLLDAGRRAGVPIVHVQPESVAGRYPGMVPKATERCVDPSPCPLPDTERGSARQEDQGGLLQERNNDPLSVSGRGQGEGSVSPVTQDSVRRSSLVHGQGYMEWEGWQRLDVALPVRPQAGDVMIATTEQFDDWLRGQGITTLLYTGFATNLCILDSPAAMKAMRALGYRCVILREATMAVEFPDTLETLGHTRAAIQYIEAWVGYSASVEDLHRALGEPR